MAPPPDGCMAGIPYFIRLRDLTIQPPSGLHLLEIDPEEQGARYWMVPHDRDAARSPQNPSLPLEFCRRV